MADNQQPTEPSIWRRFLPLIVGLAVLLALFLTPLRQWLNQIPYLWHVLYPLLTLFGAYLVMDSVRRREEGGIIAKWVILLVAALSATLHIYGAGRFFYTLSRWGALFFVVAEIIDTVLGVGEDEAGGDSVDVE